MNPAIIKGHNRQYTAPEGRESEVVTLFVREDYSGSMPLLSSAWDAEPHEAASLLAGAKIILGVSASVHPVVSLGVAELPEDFDPVITARRFHCPRRGPCARVEAMVARPPKHLRLFADEPIVAGFATALATALEEIERVARENGVSL